MGGYYNCGRAPAAPIGTFMQRSVGTTAADNPMYVIEFRNAQGDWESCHGPFETLRDAAQFTLTDLPAEGSITLPDGSPLEYRIVGGGNLAN